MTTTKTPRLLAAAIEFNIGKETLVQFLSDKGFRMNRNPSTMLSESMYNALKVEFAQDKLAKQRSENITLPKGSLQDAIENLKNIHNSNTGNKHKKKHKKPQILPTNLHENKPLSIPPLIQPIIISNPEPAELSKPIISVTQLPSEVIEMKKQNLLTPKTRSERTLKEVILQSLNEIKGAATAKDIFMHIVKEKYYDFSDALTPENTVSAQIGYLFHELRVKRKKDGGKYKYYLTENEEFIGSKLKGKPPPTDKLFVRYAASAKEILICADSVDEVMATVLNELAKKNNTNIRFIADINFNGNPYKRPVIRSKINEVGSFRTIDSHDSNLSYYYSYKMQLYGIMHQKNLCFLLC